MYSIVKNSHSFIAFLSLIFLIISTIYAFYGYKAKIKYTKKSKIVFTIGLITMHTQFLIGVLLYLLSPLGISNFSKEMMKNSFSRFYALEHPTIMLLALILITIGFSKSKRNMDNNIKFKLIAIFYSIGLILIMTRTPWSSWL